MKRQSKLFKWGLLILLVVEVLCLEDSAQSKPHYMARAVLLEQKADGYAVGVLYQAPEASANSAEVQAPFTLQWAENTSVAGAFQDIAKQSKGDISYQQSDYLLLCGWCGQSALATYAQQVQAAGYGRYAAKVSVLAQDIATIAANFEINQAAAQSLVELLSQDAWQAPRLYEAGQGSFVMPWYSLDDAGAVQSEVLFYELQSTGGRHYNEVQSKLYLLLSGRASCTFLLDDCAYTIGYRVHSWAEPLAGVRDGAQNDIAMRLNVHTQRKAMRMDAFVTGAGVSDADTKANLVRYLERLCAENSMVLHALGIEYVCVALYSFVPLVG